MIHAGDLGLTAAEYDLLLETLVTSHEIRLKVEVLNREEKPVSSLTVPVNKVLGGSVQMDVTADVTRSLSMTLLDPKRQLTFDSSNPSQGALYADNFVRVWYEVYVPTVDWVSIPAFYGPVTAFSRVGHVVNIEGQGKETLLLAPHFVTLEYHIPRHTKISDAIKTVARRAGETLFDVIDLGDKLPKRRSVTASSEPWKVIVGGGEDANGKPITGLQDYHAKPRVVFYNGKGRLVVKRKNLSPAWTFDASCLVSPPTLTYDVLNFINTVVVLGGIPKGGKKHARAVRSLPNSHPLSPYALRRNDKLRYMTLFVEAPNLKTHEACADHADHILKSHADLGIDAQFESLPIPLLEEYDQISLKTQEYHVTFPLRQYTLPLTSDSTMSVGLNRRVRVHSHRRRK